MAFLTAGQKIKATAGFRQIHLSAKTHNEVTTEDPVSNLEIIKSVVTTTSLFE